jgi:steroid 5-alpha reductase family enzyme
MTIVQLLIQNAAIVAACFAVLWGASIAIRDVSFVDSWWALGMVVLAWASFAATGAPTDRKVVLVSLCSAWGLRLGLYLLWRWRRNGPDRRYQTMAGKAQAARGIGFARWALTAVFALQGPLQFVAALPVQLGMLGGKPLGPVAGAGIALAIIGIVFESVGDAQLVAFKTDPANRERVLDTGLWRFTRHPNYFGDACVWWGLWLIAAEGGWIGAASVVGPVLLTFLLTRWSGMPTTEGRMRRKKPGYEDYVRRTPAFVPWFPKTPHHGRA